MRKRPLSVTIIGWMFIVSGGIALVADLPLAQRLAEFKEHPFEFGLVQTLRIVEVISGLLMFYGFNWARSVLGAWLAYQIRMSLARRQ